MVCLQISAGACGGQKDAFSQSFLVLDSFMPTWLQLKSSERRGPQLRKCLYKNSFWAFWDVRGRLLLNFLCCPCCSQKIEIYSIVLKNTRAGCSWLAVYEEQCTNDRAMAAAEKKQLPCINHRVSLAHCIHWRAVPAQQPPATTGQWGQMWWEKSA